MTGGSLSLMSPTKITLRGEDSFGDTSLHIGKEFFAYHRGLIYHQERGTL